MVKSTLSFHMGTSFNEQHNNRTIPVPHSDYDFEEVHNWYAPWNESLAQAYKKLFEDAFQEYNSTQRKDRQYSSYLQKLQIGMEKEKRKCDEMRRQGAPTSQIRKYKKAVKPAYEIIVGLGNARDNPEFCKGGSMQDIACEAIQEYVRHFNDANPNAYLYNASIHTGEQGTLHLHGDIIFYVDNCKRGQKKQASLTKGLNAMGYYSDQEKNAEGKRENAITKWENDQRKILRDICKEKGIEIIEGKHSKQHIATEEYKVRKESEFIEQEAGRLLKQQDDFIDFVSNSPYCNSYLEHEENKELRKAKERSNEAIKNAWEEFHSDTSEYFYIYRKRRTMISSELDRARTGAAISRKRLCSMLYDFSNSNEIFIVKLFKALAILLVAIDTRYSEKEVQRLQEENQKLKVMAKEIMASSQIVGDALKRKDCVAIRTAIDNYENQLKKSLQNMEIMEHNSTIQFPPER